ncbi:HTH domain-containing protein [Halovenus sp. WSH3]|uniref:HTH domain-containing protein n=1 Tax=Halovenus carboxidivorans TaxID=2692199 RepID=A0A6B0T3I6_9EURY|nr:DeoR family transcriptional regulator [Halovenus carboxidivorans]MXR52838.1 HTH domain-containing protein [Halovenus carboxidivorans]
MTRELDAAIQSIIDDRGPITAPEIAASLDAHPMTVRRRCQGLQRAGRIQQHLGGGYVSAAQGGQPTAAD